MNKESFQNFRERFNRLEKGFNDYVKDQSLKNGRYELYSTEYSKLKLVKTYLNLNVGGYKFSTTKETLLSQKSAFFEQLISENTNNDEIFIDRPGKYFHFILSYLRGHDFITNAASENPEIRYKLVEEAEFYGVNINILKL